MAIISEIGRRDPRVRAMLGAIAMVLAVGGLSMIYPFMIMVAGSTKSNADLKEFSPVPSFLYQDEMLYAKHLEGLFNEKLDHLNIAWDSAESTFERVTLPKNPDDRLVAEWRAFLAAHPYDGFEQTVGYLETPASQTLPMGLRDFKKYLRREISPDIAKVNAAIGGQFVNWTVVTLSVRDYLTRMNSPGAGRFQETYDAFCRTQPAWNRYFLTPEGFYKRLYLRAQYTNVIGEYNREHGTDFANYDDVTLPRRFLDVPPRPEVDDVVGLTLPDDEKLVSQRLDWHRFVRNSLNMLWVRVTDEATPLYRDYLRRKYLDIATVNRRYGTAYADFAAVRLADLRQPLPVGLAAADLENLVTGWRDPADPDPATGDGKLLQVDVRHLEVAGITFAFRDHLSAKYGGLEGINAALGRRYADILEVKTPQRDQMALDFRDMRRTLRWEFATRNYVAVVDYMLLHGRGIINTVIYCTLAVLVALIFNPLAAYAMSRYRLPSTYKLLLFLMLTMAFPPMVTQIPSFLMLRQLGLLNTFAALVLPGLAHGYSIFLLKGFFDSLPRELYEAASIEGAGEWHMFWMITMALSKPILAVIALSAFTSAYGNFMFAFIVCQDESMWTLMVWLYQLQQRSGQGVMYASLIIAAVPTFLIFLFCQNIIMRGIVVPSEK